jgi:hypothetical protein
MTDREPAVHQISSPNVCAIAPPPRLSGVQEEAARLTPVAQVISGLGAQDTVRTAAHDDGGEPTVLIEDDDFDVRESLQCLLRTISLDSRAFVSPPKFIKSDLPSGPTCLVLYIRLPGRSGLDF